MSEWLEVLRPTWGVFWLGLGLLLAILEVLDGSFVLFSIGLGFAVTSLFAFVGVGSLAALLLICAVTQVVVFGLVRPFALHVLGGRESIPTNVDALIGQTGRVVRRVGGPTESGYVKVQGEEWRAVSADATALEEGTRVVVCGLSGATLTVLPDETPEEGGSRPDRT